MTFLLLSNDTVYVCVEFVPSVTRYYLVVWVCGQFNRLLMVYPFLYGAAPSLL